MRPARAARSSSDPRTRAAHLVSFTDLSDRSEAASCSKCIITMTQGHSGAPLILIAGGGPVGLFCALLLGRRGLPVRLFEACAAPQADPRAATTHPATLEVLGEAGLVEEMARVGLVAPIVQFWDRPTRSLVAAFDHALLK